MKRSVLRIAALAGAAWFFCGGLPARTQSGASYPFVHSDSDTLILRSAGGAVMTDALSPSGLSAGDLFYIKNSDTTAPYVVQVNGGAIDGTSNGYQLLGPGQAATIQFDGTNFNTVSKPDRMRIAAGRATSLYVGPTGCSDANHGLTAAAPFCSAQRTWAVAQQLIDLNGGTLTAQLLDGYSGGGIGAQGTLVGQGPLAGFTVQGDCANPSLTQVAGSFAADDEAMFAVSCLAITKDHSYINIAPPNISGPGASGVTYKWIADDLSEIRTGNACNSLPGYTSSTAALGKCD